MFSATGASNSDLISFSGATASLTFLGAGASGRDITGVTSIQLLAATAQTAEPDPPPPSTAVSLSGNSGNAGSYDLAQLQSDFAPTVEMVNGDT
jgi:hypothetical protein